MRDLFDSTSEPDPPVETRARATDPDSSHEAADRAVRSGTAKRNAEAVLAVLERHPGATGREIADSGELPPGIDLHEVRRRLPDLKRAGLARNGATRACTVAGTKALTWWPGGAPAAEPADEIVYVI